MFVYFCRMQKVASSGLRTFLSFLRTTGVLVFPGSGEMSSEIMENFPVELARCVKILLNIEACKF